MNADTSQPVDRNRQKLEESGGMCCEIPAPPDTWSMRQQRKQSAMAVGVASGFAGFLIGGPVAGIVTGFAGAVITKKKMKKREQKAIRKYQADLSELLSPPFQD